MAHGLCYALDAQEEEVVALTCGHFSRMSKATNGTTVQALEERVYQFKQTLWDPPFGLKDLELLALEAEAWTLAVQSTVGVRLLSERQGDRWLRFPGR